VTKSVNNGVIFVRPQFLSSAGSNWTILGSDIYRNSRVLIGATTFTTTTARLEINGRISQVGTGDSIFIGEGAGNVDDFTNNFNVFIGRDAGLSNITGSSNVAIGYQSLRLSTTSNNIGIGFRAGRRITSGDSNTIIGSEAGDILSTGSRNTALGWNAGFSSNGSQWVSVGYAAARANTSGNSYVAIGYNAGVAQQTGSSWVAIGHQAADSNNGSNSNFISIGKDSARFYSGGAIAATSFSDGVYIGTNVKVASASATNEIVIGHQAEGVGSNTVVLGNTSITDTYLRGNVRTPVLLTPSSTVPASPIAGMIYFDSGLNKHRGYDGTNWNDLY
jgi:hypothetical protein